MVAIWNNFDHKCTNDLCFQNWLRGACQHSYNYKQAEAKIRAHISGPWSWLQPVCVKHYTFFQNISQKCMFFKMLQTNILGSHFISQHTMGLKNNTYTIAPDKVHKINFNCLYLCYFFTKSYVWPLVRTVSMRRF